ncbi:membrane protein [Pandoraea terrae]|uniref:Membrane protein n=1 Tax=Pandoraea terrae TaxID=1537710 RepID=A0A5E4RBJ7_9BURK|nr:entericidin A/B family lipoprotein [Pandoraea terrae]VVD59892.1 membrane protein [Pandoraea terrae]
MKRLIAIILLAGFAMGLAGCNTMRGAGQDIQQGGQKLEGAAERNK